MRRWFLTMVGVLALIAGCDGESASDRPVVRLGVAASLGRVVHALEARAETALGINVVIEAGSSGALARQIELGDSADLFISANAAWMDHLQQRGLLREETRRNLLSNRLVVVVAANADAEPTDLADLVQRRWHPLALGDPAHVPAGGYARQALQRADVWERVAPGVVAAPDVVAALAYVTAGQCPAAIVYATDATAAPGTRVAFTVDAALHDLIVYPAAVMRAARHPDAAWRLLEWLQAPEAVNVFRAAGFAPVRVAATAPPLATPVAAVTRIPAAIALSLLCAAVAVALCIPIALALAWLLARKSFRGKTIVEVLVMLPLVVPPVVTGYVLLVLLGRHGLIGAVLHDLLNARIAFTWLGAAIAQAVVALPLLVLTLRVAIESVDPDLEQAAVTMGASRRRVFWHVTLPLSRHGLGAGCVLAFARAIGEFGATIMIAGNIPGRTQTLPLAIYSAAHQPGADAAVTGLVLITIALAAAALMLARFMSARTFKSLTLPTRRSKFE